MEIKKCWGLRCTKIVLHVFQFFFLVTGLAICVVGAWSFVKTRHFVNVLDSSTYCTTVYLFLSTGCLVIFVFLIGCFAIPKHRSKLLFCYILLLVLIFLLEALAGILSYVYRENIEEEMNLNFNSTILTTYKLDESKTESIDYIQQKLKCCGSTEYLDWRYSDWIRNETVLNVVPDSCCKSISESCGTRDHPSNIYYQGCANKMMLEIKLSLWLICAVALGLSIVQVLGVIFGIVLFLQLESGHYDSNYSPSNGNENLLTRDDSAYE